MHASIHGNTHACFNSWKYTCMPQFMEMRTSLYCYAMRVHTGTQRPCTTHENLMHTPCAGRESSCSLFELLFHIRSLSIGLCVCARVRVCACARVSAQQSTVSIHPPTHPSNIILHRRHPRTRMHGSRHTPWYFLQDVWAIVSWRPARGVI